MKRGHYVILVSLAAVLIFAGLNLASWRWLGGARADFTANGLYTLSTSAKRGKLRNVSGSSVSSAHGSKVSAEFFAPEIGMRPLRRLPPRIRILSMFRLLTSARPRASPSQ